MLLTILRQNTYTHI